MRTPEMTREDLPPEKRHVWDKIAESRGRVGGPFHVLLNSPDLASMTTDVGTYIRFQSILDPSVRELATIITSREFDALVEWASHVPLAREAGVSEAAIEAVRDRKPLDGLPSNEATIIQYCRELLVKKRVGQEAFDKASELLGRQGLTELTVTMGYFCMMACCLNAFEVEPRPDLADRLPV